VGGVAYIGGKNVQNYGGKPHGRTPLARSRRTGIILKCFLDKQNGRVW
jgi:hypothetical protein